jgi:hypothetical protein
MFSVKSAPTRMVVEDFYRRLQAFREIDMDRHEAEPFGNSRLNRTAGFHLESILASLVLFFRCSQTTTAIRSECNDGRRLDHLAGQTPM